MFTVVIPLFDKEKFIDRSLQSVLKQTYQNYELIVVNDGSVDGGAKRVQRIMNNRIRLINQPNSGVSSARNSGIAASKSDFIAFLDADDEWEPDFLAEIVKLRDQYPAAGIYATAYKIVDLQGKCIYPTFREVPSYLREGLIPNYFRAAALGDPLLTASSVCAPKKILDEMGGFATGRRLGEDIDLWGRIALRYPIAFSRKINAIYHQDSENRACNSFGPGDEHPFSTTWEALKQKEIIRKDVYTDAELYVTRLRIENMRQHVLSGNLKRARELASYCKKWAFPFRQFLWGNRFNVITRRIWYRKYGRLRWQC